MSVHRRVKDLVLTEYSVFALLKLGLLGFKQVDRLYMGFNCFLLFVMRFC